MELKGSRTEANLLAAFAGESQARNKYTYYAKKARDEGLNAVAAIFEETADNEKAHAKVWFELLHEGIPCTEANLMDAAEGEAYEWTQMYAEYAAVAEEEGFGRIALLFQLVGAIEKHHEARYREYLAALKEDRLFSADGEKAWICLNCGHIHYGDRAPEVCPVCKHTRAHFKIKPNDR